MTKENEEKEEEEKNVRIAKQLYDAFRRRDISSVLDMFANDAVAHGPAPAGVLPWGGVHNGLGAIIEFLKALGESLEPRQFELHEFIAQGNKVVGLDTQRGMPSLQDGHMRLSLYISGLYVTANFQNSGYTMIQLP